jgi:pimeloyl-ACP methyl ester carboxylesterase
MGNEGPAVLLVHGFGAFWEHYRDNLRGLAEKGYRVFALTLIGFGRSEKPNVTYTELLWAELVRDFIVEVVQGPVVLAGNSIGGFTTTIVAGLWPSLVSSLILLNTAGKVIPDYKGLTYNKVFILSSKFSFGLTISDLSGLCTEKVGYGDGLLFSCMLMAFLQPRESSPIAKPVSKLLLFYLQSSSDKLLTRCYPKVTFFNLWLIVIEQ